MPQLSVFVARGFLIESTKPTWLYGTASEHSTYYQYSFYKASNIHAGMIQTESPYYQPNPKPPLPWDDKTAKFPGDPDYSTCQANGGNAGCDSSWAVRMERSSNISITGAGLYSWFNTYDESCVDPRTCQKSLVDLKDNGENIMFFHLITIGAKNMVTSGSNQIAAKDNEFTEAHPKWAHIGALKLTGELVTNVVYVSPSIWAEPDPVVQCTPTCTFVLPPSQLSTPTTIFFSSLTTILQVGWITTLTVSGTTTTKFTGITTTTTLAVPPVTTTQIGFWNVQMNSSSAGFIIYPTYSILPPPLTITDSYPPGIPGPPPTRTVQPPPWPYNVTNPASTSSSSSTNTVILLPTFTSVPQTTLSYVSTPVPGPTTTVVNGKPATVIPCWAWFFFVSHL
jgi:hypothetical protein